MDNREILQTAMRQSALELNCTAEELTLGTDVVTALNMGPGSRAYYEPPISCHMVSYGTNLVASAADDCRAAVAACLSQYDFYHCFETPALSHLNRRLEELGHRVCSMAEYYLPDMGRLRALDCRYELRLMGPADFAGLYRPEWGNALCEKRRALDVLGVGAYDGGRLVGLAGCSADCAEMWQIGVDVLPDHRRQGIASALTSRLAVEIAERGKVPFYCSAWSNLPSVRNAIKSGFLPAWVEMTAKPARI